MSTVARQRSHGPARPTCGSWTRLPLDANARRASALWPARTAPSGLYGPPTARCDPRRAHRGALARRGSAPHPSAALAEHQRGPQADRDAFISQRGHYSLDRTKITVDTDELEGLLAEAKTATTPAAERRVLERGLGLLRGEPLAGWDHVWTNTDAGRLRTTQAEFLERLAQARLTTGDARGALEATEQGLDRDTLNEALWRLGMRAETELGSRESVGRRYERLRRLLDEQLGLEPETETRTLYRELLGQR
jgi:DNA-binding SARP family transcriptional activator